MRVYQYIFVDGDNGSIETIQGTNLYKVNKNAFDIYNEYAEAFHCNLATDFFAWCKRFNIHHNGGDSSEYGWFDCKRNDFDVED